MYITDDSDLKYDRNKQERLPHLGNLSCLWILFYLKNQMISFFTFFFSSEFSLISNFS